MTFCRTHISRKTKQWLSAALVGLFAGITVQAAEVLVISEQEDDYNYMVITQFLDIMVDSSGNLELEDVQQPEIARNFTTWPHPDQFLQLNAIDQVHWVRFFLKKEGALSKPFVLENLDQHIDLFELYIPTEKGYERQTMGYAVPFQSRPYQHKNFVFDLPLTDSVQTFYAKIQSSTPNPLIFKVRPARYFLGYAVKEYYILGLFYGILAIMILYNLAIYIGVRSKLYLTYCGYVLMTAMVGFAEDGLGFHFLWPNLPEFNQVIGHLAPVGLLIFFSLYSTVFLDIKRHFPRLLTWYWVLLITYCVYYFMAGMSGIAVHSFATYLIPYIIIYALAWATLLKGHKQARFYLVGHSVMILGLVFLALRLSFKASWGNLFTVYSFQIGAVFEIALFSLALSDRLRNIEITRRKAQQIAYDQVRNNEKTVEELNLKLKEEVKTKTHALTKRTHELESSEKELKTTLEQLSAAHEKLTVQSEQIKGMNLILESSNQSLKKDVDQLVRSRALAEDVDIEGFQAMFPDDESCYRFLADLKWADGFSCQKCQNTSSSPGKDAYSCRCSKCGYLESATVDTLFHRLRFPISKAFYITFITYFKKGQITSKSISEMTDLRPNTAWSFKKRVEERISKRKPYKNNKGWTSLILNKQ